MVGLSRTRAKANDFSKGGVGPDVRSSGAAATVPGDEFSDDSTTTHFFESKTKELFDQGYDCFASLKEIIKMMSKKKGLRKF